MRCWLARPRDRPSFKDVVVSIRDLLYPNVEDESDSDHVMDTGRHEASASTTGDPDIESEVEETSFSRPGKRLIQEASAPDGGPTTHQGNEDPGRQDIDQSRDEEQELESGMDTCHTSNRAEYLIIIESPMLSSCDWILEI